MMTLLVAEHAVRREAMVPSRAISIVYIFSFFLLVQSVVTGDIMPYSSVH